MKQVNRYWKQLSAEEIAAGRHRAMIGGMWKEIGLLQLEFLKGRGLLPEHTLLDVGCGPLRGGIPLIGYLEPGHYYGLDINESLIEAGKMELAGAGLADRKPHLLVDDRFAFSRFGTMFDVALAQSVFTHLFMNHIGRCLVEVGKVLKPQGRFYATFFRAPAPLHLPPVTHLPGNKTTNYDADPFHYAFEEMEMLARSAGLRAEVIGDWKHPRGQQMLCFYR